MFSVRGCRVLLARVISGSLLASLLLSGCSSRGREATPPSRTDASWRVSPSAAVEPATGSTGGCTVPNFTSSTHVTVTDVRPAACCVVPPHANAIQRQAARRACT